MSDDVEQRHILALDDRDEARRQVDDLRREITALRTALDKLAFPLAQLRHLYPQMLRGEVVDMASAAYGIVGPAIVQIERVMASITPNTSKLETLAAKWNNGGPENSSILLSGNDQMSPSRTCQPCRENNHWACSADCRCDC